MASCKPTIQGIVDTFCTLLGIGTRKQPYLCLMRLAREAGWLRQADDAHALMTQELGLAAAAERLKVRPPSPCLSGTC